MSNIHWGLSIAADDRDSFVQAVRERGPVKLPLHDKGIYKNEKWTTHMAAMAAELEAYKRSAALNAKYIIRLGRRLPVFDYRERARDRIEFYTQQGEDIWAWAIF